MQDERAQMDYMEVVFIALVTVYGGERPAGEWPELKESDLSYLAILLHDIGSTMTKLRGADGPGPALIRMAEDIATFRRGMMGFPEESDESDE